MDVREKLIELLDTNCGYVDEVKAEVLADYLIANGATIQKQGKWEVKRHEHHTNAICSVCGENFYYFNKGQYNIDCSNYCPNCGAIMIYSSAKMSD